MTFRIRAIHLFNYNHERHTLNFDVDDLNIITGASGRGKSSVIDIISYCLGSGDNPIKAGVIRDTVELFALELQTAEGIAVVARPAPQEKRESTTRMHVSFRSDLGTRAPEYEELQVNADVESAIQFLSQRLGITENVTEVGKGTRRSYAATVRHALYFTVQAQDEIASPDLLFHNQNEEWIPQSIRDVIPFFLGAVDPYFVLKRERLRQLERSVRVYQRRLDEEGAIVGASARARALLSEAAAAGLTSAGQLNAHEDVLAELAAAATVQDDPEALSTQGLTDQIRQLREEREELRVRHGSLLAETRQLRRLARYSDEFSGEAGEQRARLSSLGLLRLGPHVTDAETCPVCQAELENPPVGVAEIQESLARVDAEIANVGNDLPQIQRLIAENEDQLSGLVAELNQNEGLMDRLSEGQRTFEQVREVALLRATVRGRISLYLDSVSKDNEASFLAQELERLTREAEALRADLDTEAAEERFRQALSVVSSYITAYAGELELEHSPSPVFLNVAHLTLNVRTSAGTYRLNQIGSGENWLGYHLATFMALQKFFVEESRPLPRFLILDQPSQVYFPSEESAEAAVAADVDRQRITAIYAALLDFAREMKGEAQVIVLDHFDLRSEKWFDERVKYRWRGEDGLIPADWISRL